MKPERWRGLFWVALLIVLDQGTKLWAVHSLHYQQARPVFPGFNLTLMHNPGAAFSLLAEAGGWQRWLFVGLAVAVSGLLLWMLAQTPLVQRLQRAALLLILGGALGNLIDRLRLGYVIDFVELYYRTWSWPAFNVADSAITVGAGFLLCGAFLEGAQGSAGKP